MWEHNAHIHRNVALLVFYTTLRCFSIIHSRFQVVSLDKYWCRTSFSLTVELVGITAQAPVICGRFSRCLHVVVCVRHPQRRQQTSTISTSKVSGSTRYAYCDRVILHQRSRFTLMTPWSRNNRSGLTSWLWPLSERGSLLGYISCTDDDRSNRACWP